MKKLSAILIIIACSWVQLQAVVPSTKKLRLTRGWEFIRQDMANVWEVMRPVKAGQPESVPLWKKVTLPHCFNAEDAVDPDINYYQGPGWYKTSLSIDNPYKNGRILLEFEGAGQQTDVYVYTTKVGSHTGGYDGWVVDITDAVNAFSKTDTYQTPFDKKIPIAVRCDNSRNTERIPSDMSDFTIYGGLYRYVNLIYVPSISLKQVQITPLLDKENKNGKAELSISLYNPQHLDVTVPTVQLSLSIKDPHGKEIWRNALQTLTKTNNPAIAQKHALSDRPDRVTYTVDVRKPALWDMDNPQLYTCSVTLNVEGQSMSDEEHFGFRNYEFKDKGPFYLNGKRLLLHGTHRHEDHAGVGAAMTEEMMAKEMKMIKDMGANFIRLGHYQQSDIILNLCDKLGILVWEEIPWCRGGLGHEAYKAQARRMLTHMIEQHHNHPSIILWGLGNENDWPGDFPTFNKDSIRIFMTELNDLAHQLDKQRKTCIRRCDFCKDIVDVYSPSIWAGWYSRSFTDYKSMITGEMQKVKHFFHAEWGGDSHPGRYSESDFNGVSNAVKNGDWSESYIVRLFDWHLKEQETMPNLTGSAFWTFKDFATPLRPENPIPYVNQKGVVERDLTPKESYYVVQSYWSKKPMVHISGHNCPTRWGKKHESKEILVYSNCPEVELFVNGVSQGKRKRDSQDFPAAGLHWYVPLQEGKNDIKAIAAIQMTKITDQITQQYQIAQWEKDAQMEMSYTPLNQSDTTLIQVQVKDKNGIPCLDSNRMIEFQLAGEGLLIQNQGTSTGSRKIEVANGRARIKAIIKGKCTIFVKSKNIPPNFITIFAGKR